MRVILPEDKNHVFTDLSDVRNAIFLAGPCLRVNYSNDWRFEALRILDELGFDGTVLNPTNPNYDENDSKHLIKQTHWEEEAMSKASAIVFWIERSDEHPALTTNIEFGMWLGKPGVFVGWTDNATHNRYIDVKLKDYGMKRYDTLKNVLQAAVDDLSRHKKRWFLSDTHFSQQRTLELSKRPFRDVRDMDLTMISNWNKNVREQDDVFFLGDFGETFDYIKLLNFKNLFFVLGNYERQNRDGKDITQRSVDTLTNMSEPSHRIYVFDRGDCQTMLSNGQTVVAVHEPINPDKTDVIPNDNQLFLYGHIHGRTFYKTNGTDCGVDIHQYAPISEDEIIWRLNAIKFLDENVWNMTCQ